MDDLSNGIEPNVTEWGETVERPTEDVMFKYSFHVHQEEHVLKVNLKIPLKGSIRELTNRMITSHNIPSYISSDLYRTLDAFIHQKTKGFNNSNYTKMHEAMQQSGVKEHLQQDCSKVFSLNNDCEKSTCGVDSTWSDIYHQLIHSPALESMLQMEHKYNVEMKILVSQRDQEIQELTSQHVSEMEQAIENIGYTTTDTYVNQLASRQYEESQMKEISWSSAISQLKEKQKHEYKEWVQNVYEKTIADISCNDIPQVLSLPVESSAAGTMPSTQDTYMEESFTIHLGNQMKSMHNIRLVCRDILDYCRCKSAVIGGSMVANPQRLQTAMTLYSENLSAMIFLVDDKLNSSIGLKKGFQDIVQESTDFHFPDYEQQRCLIEQVLIERPNQTTLLRSNSISRSSHQQNSGSSKLLQTGDFYVTKHSNLAEVHAVFHLVTDDCLSTMTINSRHPIMTGVRNIILAAARHNITNLVIPLLLVHEMSENLTMQWCMKRAELVFKCVKGFMMESLSWDGNDSRTVQFVVPTGISEDMFISLTNMLPTIFRVSTTLNLSNKHSKVLN